VQNEEFTTTRTTCQPKTKHNTNKNRLKEVPLWLHSRLTSTKQNFAENGLKLENASTEKNANTLMVTTN
jgi:hypothetical protein